MSRRIRPGGLKIRPWEEPKPELRRRLLKQCCLVSIGALGHFCLGTVLTWPSPGLSDMAVNNLTIVGTELSLTVPEMDLAGSLVFLGSLVGSFVAGWLVSVLGRRRSLQLNSLPFALGWFVCGLSPTPEVFLAGRFLLGLGVGSTAVCGTSYIIELSDTNLRGIMSVVPNLSVILGGQYTLGLGMLLPWHYLSLACLAPVSVLFAASLVLPESPSFLVTRGRRADASDVLRRLRGNYVDIEEELDDLERRNQLCRSHRNTRGCKALLKRKILCRMGVVTSLFLFQQLSGNFVLIIQAGRVLESTGIPFDPAAAANIVVAMRLGGTIVSFFLLDRIGRRYCLAISHAVSGSSLMVLGAFIYLNDIGSSGSTFTSLKWVPMVCIGICLFFGDIGLHPIPYTLAAEYFPTTVRTQASSICISLGTIFSFLTLQCYSPMKDLLTQAGLYWFYGSSSFLATIFILVCVTETKSRPIG